MSEHEHCDECDYTSGPSWRMAFVVAVLVICYTILRLNGISPW